MTVTPEEIAAFADGELTGERKSAVALVALANPDVAQQIERHRAFKAMLADHYAPVAQEPVPSHLRAGLEKSDGSAKTQGEVVDLAAAQAQRTAEKPRNFRRWGWIAGPALAASLVLAVTWPNQNVGDLPYADPQLSDVLSTQLVASQATDSETRILLSFQDKAGRYCRAFSGSSSTGIACRDNGGWRLETVGEGGSEISSDYRMAGSNIRAILQRAQEMADGPALDASGEAQAMGRNWLN
ncbi:MAG: hypothetical protein CL820_14050 [Croceicoccus sp.]|nr:hypothetical protein [Croceicoccus sp.]